MPDFPVSLTDILCLKESGVISIVGAGGKTTLLFRLAGEFADKGDTVLTTTTTKMYKPTPAESRNIIITPDYDKLALEAGHFLSKGNHVTAAAEFLEQQNKISGYPPETLDRIFGSGLFSWIIVEADGSAGRSLKAPADYEPVVPSLTTHHVAVIGLDVIGKPLGEEHVKRHEIFSELTGLHPGEPVDEESVARVITHGKGIFKGGPFSAQRVLVLNKADTDELVARGQRIAGLLQGEKSGIIRVIVCALKRDDPVIDCIAL